MAPEGRAPPQVARTYSTRTSHPTGRTSSAASSRAVTRRSATVAVTTSGSPGGSGADIERSAVRLPEGPLRVLGEHDIEIHLHTDVNVPLKVVLESSEPVAEPVVDETDLDDTDDTE